MCVSITAVVNLCLYIDRFFISVVVDVSYLTNSKIVLFYSLKYRILTLSNVKTSAVCQGKIYAGLKQVFELQFNIEVVQGNTNSTMDNEMWL